MNTTDTIEVINVTQFKKYVLEINFSDNTSQVIDFEPFLTQSHNPLTKKYMQPEHFKSFRIEFGDLIWGDYELCFPIWDLHEGKI